MDTTAIFEFLRSRAKFAVAAAGLFAAGTLTSPLERVAWSEARERIGAFSPEALGSSAGTGVALGTLGGFRTVIADVAWLRAFHFWETRDAVACLKFAELAMTLAPEQFFFLENAANYIAFDFPVWEIRRRGGTRQVPAPVRRENFYSRCTARWLPADWTAAFQRRGAGCAARAGGCSPWPAPPG